MHRFGAIFYAIWFVRLAGVLEALLLARLIARIAAARPDNPSIDLLYRVTSPLIAPLAFLDAEQPLFGASLEFATLTLAIAVPLVTAIIWLMVTQRATEQAEGSS